MQYDNLTACYILYSVSPTKGMQMRSYQEQRTTILNRISSFQWKIHDIANCIMTEFNENKNKYDRHSLLDVYDNLFHFQHIPWPVLLQLLRQSPGTQGVSSEGTRIPVISRRGLGAVGIS